VGRRHLRRLLPRPMLDRYSMGTGIRSIRPQTCHSHWAKVNISSKSGRTNLKVGSCTMIACILFGFSRTLIWAILARAMAGFSNGNVGIIRTTVAELVPERELQPRAFSVMPLVWTIGSIFGPAFGGALANPAARYPHLFGENKFFKAYPFALPNLVACIFFTTGLSTGFLFLHVRVIRPIPQRTLLMFPGNSGSQKA
jgi:hypothetical protein